MSSITQVRAALVAALNVEFAKVPGAPAIDIEDPSIHDVEQTEAGRVRAGFIHTTRAPTEEQPIGLDLYHITARFELGIHGAGGDAAERGDLIEALSRAAALAVRNDRQLGGVAGYAMYENIEHRADVDPENGTPHDTLEVGRIVVEYDSDTEAG